MSESMEFTPQVRKKRTFRSTLLLFVIGALALFAAISAGISYFPDNLEGSKRRIGVIDVEGAILDSKNVVRQLIKYRDDSSIQGIIVRINSPGGGVAPSQEIYEEILRTREKKKVYSSLGSLAASGGYYIASATERIVANSGTLTGSIGAIMFFSNAQELIHKIGLEPEIIKSGKFKDAGSPTRSMTGEERELLQTVVDDVHQQFMEAISKGRNMPVEEVKALADGRIFTGKQAFNLKLVDQLGSFEESLDTLGKALGIVGRPKVIQEKESSSFLDWIIQSSFPQRVTSSLLPFVMPSLQYLWHIG